MNIGTIVGLTLAWALAVILLLAYPFSEFARGMATNPSQHSRSPGAMAASVVGLVLIVLLLTGCSTPAVKTETVEVKVPVAVQPIRAEQVPAVPRPLGPRPPSLSAAADVLLGKWCEAVGYMLRADPLLRLSAGQQPAPLPKFPECER